MWAYNQSFFSQKLGEVGWGGGDYGQLRYTHSVSPYRSIATGGSHFLANGCFHRSRQRSVFPFNSIISPLPSVSSLFSSVPSPPPPTFPPIPSLLPREISSPINLIINLRNFVFLVSSNWRWEVKKKRETVEKFYSMKYVGMLLLASDGRKDGSRCTKRCSVFWAYFLSIGPFEIWIFINTRSTSFYIQNPYKISKITWTVNLWIYLLILINLELSGFMNEKSWKKIRYVNVSSYRNAMWTINKNLSYVISDYTDRSRKSRLDGVTRGGAI